MQETQPQLPLQTASEQDKKLKMEWRTERCKHTVSILCN